LEDFYNEGVSHSEPARMGVFPGVKTTRPTSIQGMLGVHPARGALAVAGLREIAAVLGDGEQGSQGPEILDGSFGEAPPPVLMRFDD